MDRKNTRNISGNIDMLSSLPDELLIRILSLLPTTKDAALMCLVSKKMKCVFSWITTLDFDDSPISHCSQHPYAIERFSDYKMFVDTLLNSYQSPYLSRFRLRVGANFAARYFHGDKTHFWKEDDCFPEIRSTQINAWISFPLTRCGLRELDLRIQVRDSGDCQLPAEIFTYETLEVLKLDVKIGLEQVSKLSSIRLPSLKLLHFRASLKSEPFADTFVTRLVSSCPLLEEVTVEAVWNNVRSTTISSPSLRRLCLRVCRPDEDCNPIFVVIHTPNLEYFDYYDNLAMDYSFSCMPSLVKANINILLDLENGGLSQTFKQMRNLVKPFSNVRHLSLLSSCTQDLEFVEEEDMLSLFPNLTRLELGCDVYTTWDKLLLSFLNGSPVLETLIFPEGVIVCYDTNEYAYGKEEVELQQKFFRTTQEVIPMCCRFHLKRIVIKNYFGNEFEKDMIQFLLTHALVLKELVVHRNLNTWHPIVDQKLLETTLKKLPRASISCSIQVH